MHRLRGGKSAAKKKKNPKKKKKQQDDDVIHDERHHQSEEEDVEPRRSKRARIEKSSGPDFVSFMVENLPSGCKPLGYRWIFKKKVKANGTIDKYKARLVIKAIRNLEVHQIDVKTAFLNRDLEGEIYIEQPEGFTAPGKEGKVEIKNEYGDGALDMTNLDNGSDSVGSEENVMKVNIVDNVVKDSESVVDLDAKNMNHNVEKINDNKKESQTMVMDDVLHVSGPEDNKAESANEVEEQLEAKATNDPKVEDD
ncbi:retrotransposon protein, putative, ty1-copia subclass [Tanacetum coccineum]|uniref:Retrotransposon protein, putative, ty1-copia subclass n=1 Tax=Tanacetum coccineum TaxID=301880 RepID=A0ABQ5IIQ7_9ASTR